MNLWTKTDWGTASSSVGHRADGEIIDTNKRHSCLIAEHPVLISGGICSAVPYAESEFLGTTVTELSPSLFICESGNLSRSCASDKSRALASIQVDLQQQRSPLP